MTARRPSDAMSQARLPVIGRQDDAAIRGLASIRNRSKSVDWTGRSRLIQDQRPMSTNTQEFLPGDLITYASGEEKGWRGLVIGVTGGDVIVFMVRPDGGPLKGPTTHVGAVPGALLRLIHRAEESPHDIGKLIAETDSAITEALRLAGGTDKK